MDRSPAGLVVPMRNRGFRVKPILLEALQRLFAVRELLEGSAMTTLARRRPEDAGTTRAIAREIQDAVELEDVPAYIRFDRAFHQELASQAGNPLLTRLIIKARDSIQLYGIDTRAGRERQRASVNEHFHLIDFAESGEVNRAAKLISSHILDWMPIFTGATRNQGGRI